MVIKILSEFHCLLRDIKTQIIYIMVAFNPCFENSFQWKRCYRVIVSTDIFQLMVYYYFSVFQSKQIIFASQLRLSDGFIPPQPQERYHTAKTQGEQDYNFPVSEALVAWKPKHTEACMEERGSECSES